MPQRVILAAIGFPRNGKTVYPEIGQPFDMTSGEIEEITKLEKASGNQMIRKLVNESGDDDQQNDQPLPNAGQQTQVEDPYANMTVAQLKQLAADRGVDLGDATRKDDIVTVLKAAQAPAPESEDI